MLTQRADLTFKHNLKQGRHGWLRLTPAYSIRVVGEILDQIENPGRVLDPFCGTGTTGLVCAERGLACDLIELNPFLAWFAIAKTRNYAPAETAAARQLVKDVVTQYQKTNGTGLGWVPSIHRIDRWWSDERLRVLSHLFQAIQINASAPTPAIDLLKIAFCRLLIDWSNAAFNHQSMSFKETAPTLFGADEQTLMLEAFRSSALAVLQAAETPLPGQAHIYAGDAREAGAIALGPYTTVITSPPYPNRMSYIRELRPYMYWLGYLADGREAGELDWQAIGGTWGIATSRLQQWQANGAVVEHAGFADMIDRIGQSSSVLARYVHKYFIDIAQHLLSLKKVLAPGAHVHYIVGNSKFYDTLVSVEQIYASLFRQMGFDNVQIKTLRKRNSKKELIEFCVEARYPGA